MELRVTANPEDVIQALTSEIPNYVERLVVVANCPPSELWMLYLASSGRMEYAGHRSDHESTGLRTRVPNAPILDGRTRYEIWKLTLIEVIRILGDPEARYRTGWETATLIQGVSAFFDM